MPNISHKRILVLSAFFAALAYIAYIRHFSAFGFYGDDHAFFGAMINRDWSEGFAYLWFSLTNWPQGRPLGMGLNLHLIPYLTFHLTGFHGLHATAGLIVVANCVLLYRLIGQYHTHLVALSAAGFYALAPADTVQHSLVFAYNFEIAILFGILAAQTSLRGRFVWFAILTCISLLMVEPVAMFALLAPLFLSFRRERAWIMWAIRHVAIWTFAVFAVLVARRLIGDPWGSERVSELATHPMDTLQHGLTSAITGFFTHFDLVFERLLQPLSEADASLWVIMLSASLITGIIVWAPRLPRTSHEGSTTCLIRDESNWWPGLRLLLAGSAIMLAVYFCYFRAPWYPANARTGFMSGVHVIAALGSCFIFAGMVSVLHKSLPGRFQYVVQFVPVFVLACLAGFGELVQRDYAQNWAFQRDFWRAYERLCPDATEGTFILVLDRNLPTSRYIELFSWGSEVLPDKLFQYRNLPLIEPLAEGGKSTQTESTELMSGIPITHPPSVILTAPELVTAIRYESGRYSWKPTYYFMLPKSPEEQPTAHNVIVMVYDQQRTWQRLTGELMVDGGTLPLRPTGGDNLLRRAHASPLAAIYGL